MFKSISFAALALACALSQSATPLTANATSPEVKVRTQLTAQSATNPLASGKAKFESKGGRARLSVQVEDAGPAGTLNVWIDGALIGSVTVDALGLGDLNLDSKVGDAVPSVGSGSTVRVTAADGTVILSGTF